MFSTSHPQRTPLYNNIENIHQQNQIYGKNGNIKNYQDNIQNGHVDVEYPIYQNLTFNGNIGSKSRKNNANDPVSSIRQPMPFSAAYKNGFPFEAESFPSFQMLARREQMRQQYSDRHSFESGRQSVPLNLMQQFQKPIVRNNKFIHFP
jgi:hypothetical protein